MTPDWLSQLAPAHAPPAPDWWPLAPGWWGLAMLLALAAAALLWLVWLDPRRSRRRVALRELRALAQEHARGEIDVQQYARGIENILRRYALSVFGPAEVARLSGEAWLTFTARHGGALLAGETGRSLLAAAFGPPRRASEPARQAEWLTAAATFIRDARAPS